MFRVVTGGAYGMSDLKWFADHLPDDGSAQIHDQTNAWTHARPVGPARPRHPAEHHQRRRLPRGPSRSPAASTIEVGPVQVLASRISYVGDLGWELYVPIEQGARLWDIVAEAGEPHGIIPAGIGVYGTTGRLEKCYRAYGAELEGDFNVVEAGMAWGKVKDQDFIGKEAHLRHRDGGARGDHVHADRRRPHLVSRASSATCSASEPILTRDGEPLTDRKGRRSYVTSAGAGPSVGKHILMSYLPPEHAVVGAELAVEYMGERYPVTVATADSTPLFDPDNSRVRSLSHEHPRLRQARAAHRRQDRADRRRARDLRPATSASRSARTRSAAPRRRSA